VAVNPFQLVDGTILPPQKMTILLATKVRSI